MMMALVLVRRMCAGFVPVSVRAVRALCVIMAPYSSVKMIKMAG